MSGKLSLDAELGGASLRHAITPGGHLEDRSQPAFPSEHRKFGNPSPLGLASFSLTTFCLSLVNANAHGVVVPNYVVGLALFYGGLVQILAGMWEMAVGQTFGATAFTSYGAFWISFAFIISPWSGIGAAYTDAAEFGHAIGFFLVGWTIFTFIMWIGTLRSSIALSSVFFLLLVTLTLLSANQFVDMPVLGKAGGYFGIFTAFNGWYVAAAGLLTPDTSYFLLPVGDLSRRN